MNLKFLIAVFLMSLSFGSIKEANVINASSVVEVDVAIQNVIDLINALPNNCTLENEDEVKKCRQAYDKLLPSQKVEVENYLTLLEKENQIAILYSEISNVIKLIDSLPDVENFELSDEQKLKEIINAYNKLDNLQKELVSNYSKLRDLSNKLEKIYSSIEEVINLINTLPNKDLIDTSIYELITKIETVYYSLSDIQKGKITNINIYLEIKNILTKIDVLIESINNIPLKLVKEDLILLQNIEGEYNKLTASQKNLVTNYSIFKEIYIQVNEALEFDELINSLIDSITLENRGLLDYLLNKYNTLNDNQKVFISNYYRLVALEEKFILEEEYKLSALKVIDLINGLPLEITLSNKEEVREVRKKYDSLDINSKKYVSNYHLLLEAESKIIKLENEEVTNNLDNLSNEIDELLNEINALKEETKNNEEESKSLIEEIKVFMEEVKENEAKGLNKYIIIAIGLTSVFIIVAVIYIFSLHQSKINIDKEDY